nr:hypothetical protein [Tanacetum cinerariifolium]
MVKNVIILEQNDQAGNGPWASEKNADKIYCQGIALKEWYLTTEGSAERYTDADTEGRIYLHQRQALLVGIQRTSSIHRTSASL